jgi:hypothetical protein
MSDVPAGADVAGSPAQPLRAFFREVATVRRLVRQDAKRSGRAETVARQGPQTESQADTG